jgi:hypothetical protein
VITAMIHLHLIETKLKPSKLDFDEAFEEKGFNYVVDMYTKWWRTNNEHPLVDTSSAGY